MAMFYGKRFLVLEDEPLIALDIASEIEHLGGEVVADLRSVSAAEKALKTLNFDAAILDHKLSDGTSVGIGQALRERGTPFVFCTGGMADDVTTGSLSGVTVWQKPCDWPVLLERFAREIAEPERAAS
ncbi:response regulator [Notoacmeibacter sp. MSK16QG-6]|uniref:response regulator n=1 Tax=Notoacmeibacter sp. MSK16QG-6 TaxID=2957982 RepID=UPI00209FB740|nr:response regulator [Notoacmeibacter sp. MSK16QG-6]MCP1198045.1 response regulator [Notoacmeibacter sp. MSK16QG-6]